MTSPHEQALAAAVEAVHPSSPPHIAIPAAIAAYLAALPAPDLADWEKAAEGVTPGPWFRSGVRGKAAQLGGGNSRAEYHSISRYDEAKKTDENIAAVWYDPRTGLGLNDADWIARCSPDNVLSALRSLSARLAEAERERDEKAADLRETLKAVLYHYGPSGAHAVTTHAMDARKARAKAAEAELAERLAGMEAGR